MKNISISLLSCDIKGYKLYEGTISGDGIYNYSFYRYW